MGLLIAHANTEEETGKTLEKQLWKLMAMVARYAHQPVTMMRRMLVRDLQSFADAVGELIEEEAEAVRQRTDAD